jgi:hypothetical protein
MSFVTVRIFTNPWDAYIVKGRLESEGITVFIANEHHIWVNWPLSNALGGVKLQVSKNQVEQAEKIIELNIEGIYSKTSDDNEVEEENVCPNCGSNQFSSRLPVIKLLLVLLTLGIAIIFPIRANKHKCLMCQQRWTY